jgi:hypothetical protein
MREKLAAPIATAYAAAAAIAASAKAPNARNQIGIVLGSASTSRCDIVCSSDVPDRNGRAIMGFMLSPSGIDLKP